MKKIISFICMLAISLVIIGCLDDEAPETKEVPLQYDSMELEYNNIKYSCGEAEPIKCFLPYKTDKTSLRLYFSINEALSIYIDGVKVVSGESVFDFTNGVTFVMKDKKGNERIEIITVTYNANTEAKLYSLSVMLYNSATSAYDLEYPCAVDEVNKKVTVNIDRIKSELGYVLFRFVISEYATFSLGNNTMNSEQYAYSLRYLIEANLTDITVKAQNTQYTTDYQFVVSCQDCVN